jgi:hypothetical protein
MFAPMPCSPETHVATSTAEYGLGSRYSRWDEDYGYQEWMYVQNNGSVAAVAGSVARISDQGLGTVTCDINDDQLGANVFGGIFRVACAADYCQFVCIGGRFPDAKGDNAVAAGEFLVANADSVCDTAATLEYDEIFGVALEAFATDTLGDVLIYFGRVG